MNGISIISEDNNIKRPLLNLAGAFVLGEVFALSQMWVRIGLLACIMAGCLLWWKKGRNRAYLSLPFFVMFCAAAVGFLRFQTVCQSFERQLEEMADKETISCEGKVISVKWTEPGVKLSAVVETGKRRCMVYVNVAESEFPVVPGQRVRLHGELSAMEAATNLGQFDAKNYYRSQGIVFCVFADSVMLVERTEGGAKGFLFRLRTRFASALERVAAPEDVGLFEASVLGERSNLLEDISVLYQRNGIAHLLAISGLHIALIGAAFYDMLRKLGWSFASAAIGGGMFLVAYAILTGSSVSAVRATVMLVCGFAAAYKGKTYDLLSAMSLSLMMILWEYPYQVLQSGFQLSFGAIVGIGLIRPILAEYLNSTSAIAGTVAAGVAVQMITIPVLVWNYYTFSPYGFFLNLVVIPLMPLILISGMLGILTGMYVPMLGTLAVGAGHYVIRFYEWLCEAAQKLPFAVMVLGRPALWQVAVYAGVYGVLLWWMKGVARRRSQESLKQGSMVILNQRWKQRGISSRAGRMMLLLILLEGMPLLLRVIPPSGLTATFVDVGQGDCIVLRTCDAVMMNDGGSSSVTDVGKYRIEPYLKSQGITRLDAVFVSHADEDHINGILYLIEEGQDIQIGQLVLSCAGKEDEAYEKLWRPAAEKGIPIYWASAGDTWQGKDDRHHNRFDITCLYPKSGFSSKERNEHSLVLQVKYGMFQTLLTGDAGETSEQAILQGIDAAVLSQTQLLKAGHHGSRYSTSEAWLEGVRPSWTVISCGADNRYGHPHQEVIDRLNASGSQIYRTDKSGAITCHTDGKNLKIKLFMEQKTTY